MKLPMIFLINMLTIIILIRLYNRILNCYVFSVLNYECESWTWNKAMQKKIDAFEFWCYRRMLKISYVDRVSNKELLKRMHTELHFRKDMWKRKMELQVMF